MITQRLFTLDLETTDGRSGQMWDAEADWRPSDEETQNYIYGVDKGIPAWEEDLETRVFMGGIQDFTLVEGLGNYYRYLDLNGTLENLAAHGHCLGWVHNLRYDYAYIISHLLHLEYKPMVTDRALVATKPTVSEFVEAKKGTWNNKPRSGEFQVNKNDMNIVFSLTYRHPNGTLIEMRDSMKLLGGQSLEALGKNLGMSQKLVGTFDYNAVREIGYVPTEMEEEYLKMDCMVIAEAMREIIKREPLFAKCLTIGSVARRWFITNLDKSPNPTYRKGYKIYRQLFPELTLEMDTEIRQGYVGGYCYVNKGFNGGYSGEPLLITDHGYTVDVNSLYPSVMVDHDYPIGFPEVLESPRNWVDDGKMVGYVKLVVTGRVKHEHFPTLQAKGNSRFGDTEYIYDTGDEGVTVTLPLPLYRLMQDHYEIERESILKVWLFESASTIFNEYVNHWYAVKAQAGRDGDKVLYMIAKLMLNNLYGKLSQRGERGVAVPFLDEDGMVRDEVTFEQGSSEYIPAGAYITAHARVKLITGAQPIFRYVAYMDTDSQHCTVLPPVEIDPYILGAWNMEARWSAARFVRQKCYVELEVGFNKDDEWVESLNIKAGGATKAVKENLTRRSNTWDPEKGKWLGAWSKEKRVWEGIGDGRIMDPHSVIHRFAPGVSEIGKLMQKTVVGGVRLTNTTWRIALPHGSVINKNTGIVDQEWTTI